MIKEAIFALQKRLQELSIEASAEQLAYLAKSVESIAGQTTALDFVNLADDKIRELTDLAKKHLSELNNNKDKTLASVESAAANGISTIDEKKDEALEELDTKAADGISLLDSRKNANIADIDLAFAKLSEKMLNYKTIKEHALPVLFASFIPRDKQEVNRELLLNIVVGLADVTFDQIPQMLFLPGKGSFKKALLQDEIQALGAIFIKNTTDKDIITSIKTDGQIYAATNNVTAKSIEWQDITDPTKINFVAGNTTAVIISSTNIWQISNLRESLKPGLEIDIELTLRAYQCRGFKEPYELWQ